MVMSDNDVYTDQTWFLAHRQSAPAGPRLVTLCREMALRQTQLIENTEKCMAVFEYGGGALRLQPGAPFPIEDHLLTFNRAQNIVETAYAKIIKSRIALMVYTEGGGYLQQARAKEASAAIEGVLEANEFEEVEEDVVLDELVSDHAAGAVIVTDQCDEVKIEHVPIEDIWFDEAETRHRTPRSCYRVPKGGIDKFVACEMFASDDPEKTPEGAVGTAESRRAAILAAANSPETWRQSKSVADVKSRVDIFEAWHLPSGPVEEEEYEEDEEYENDDGERMVRTVKKTRPKHDGRHVVAVNVPDGTLIDEPWDGKGGFPVLLSVPRRRRRTIWGLSLMRDLIAPQREHEKVSMKIQAAHQKVGVSMFSAPMAAKINVRELTAGTFAAGALLEFEGQQGVTQLTPEPVAPGTYQYREGIAREMGEAKGISQLATMSAIPAGLQQASGKALQVFDDFDDVRLLPYHRERERFRVRLAWLVVHCARRIVERKGSYETTYRGKHGIEKVDWKELLEDMKDFKIRVASVNALSKNPAAKFDQAMQMRNSGDITPVQFRRLIGFPDLEAEDDLDMADYDLIAKSLDTMVVKGKYVTPMPTDNFELAISMATKFISLCRLRDVPEDRIKLVIDYIEDVKGERDRMNGVTPTMPGVTAAAGPTTDPTMPTGGGGPPPMPPEMAAAMPPVAA
jgi:hypothetical protein